MPLIARFILAAGIGAIIADSPSALTVLRANPTGAAARTSPITVTFDRPVAGSLDRSVDPRTVLEIVPEVAGIAEWRDPVTIRFRPAAPLPSNTAYTVTVRDNFTAMDGSRLARPFRFTDPPSSTIEDPLPRIGYHASHEQLAPSELLACDSTAERRRLLRQK